MRIEDNVKGITVKLNHKVARHSGKRGLWYEEEPESWVRGPAIELSGKSGDSGIMEGNEVFKWKRELVLLLCHIK